MRRLLLALDNLRRFRPQRREWYRDLCDYYGVTPEQVLKLGQRAPGRKPDLPGSATTNPLSGRSFEEIWEDRTRDNPEDIHSFYREMGAWATFRQVVLHRNNRFRNILRRVRPGANICEYGAGVAPLSFCCLETLRRPPALVTIADLDCEHFTFGKYRLNRLIQEIEAPVKVEALEVETGTLPLRKKYQTITILEVFEHLYNPLEVARHLTEHLDRGGYLWENYLVEEEVDGSDLQVAQEERPQVVAHFRSSLDLVEGRDPDSSQGGGTRCWRKM